MQDQEKAESHGYRNPDEIQESAENVLRKRTSLLDVLGGGDELEEPLIDDAASFEFEDNPDDRDFTWRSAVMGSILGSIIGLSNIYLGLKIGITQGAALFATMLGGIVMKPVLSVTNRINKKHQMFGPKEHCCFQSAASAAGSLNGGLVAGVIGLFWLQYDDQVSERNKMGGFIGGAGKNALSIILIVFSAVCFGVFMAVPYRKVFIINQSLQFPDGLASAEIIKSMYKKGRDQAQDLIQAKKIRVMGYAFVFSICFYLLSVFFPAFVSWNVFANLSSCGAGQSIDACFANPPSVPGPNGTTKALPIYPVMAYAAAWGWRLSLDPVMVGTAFIVPHHVNVWFFVGGVLAYGIIGPVCLMMGEHPAGKSVMGNIKYIKEKTLLWPAVFVVIIASLVNIALEYKAFNGMFGGIKGGDEGEKKRGFAANSIWELKVFFKKQEDANIDRSDEQTPLIIWLSMMLFFMTLSFFTYTFYFGDRYGIQAWMVIVTFLSCILLALVFLQILGKTNWGLISVMGKVIVMTLGVANAPIAALLMMGNLVGQTMSQIGDLIQCYKTGHLIRASPQAQFMANIVGSAFGIFTAVGGFLLFTVATPCILEFPTPDDCAYQVPSAKAWYLLAKAFSGGFTIGVGEKSTMTPTGLYVCIIMTIMALISNTAKKVISIKAPVLFRKIHGFFPLYAVMFVPFLIPAEMAVATFIGTCLKFAWGLINRKSLKQHATGIGAGFMTGGAMGGALYAVMKIAGLKDTDIVDWGKGYGQ